jgi:hypothetical protein
MEMWFIPEMKGDQSGERLKSYLAIMGLSCSLGIANGPQFIYTEQRYQSASFM